jgi:hypothetical protein
LNQGVVGAPTTKTPIMCSCPCGSSSESSCPCEHLARIALCSLPRSNWGPSILSLTVPKHHARFHTFPGGILECPFEHNQGN